MALLLLNHVSESGDMDRILEMVVSLCLRVEKEGEDMEDVRQAAFMRACCYLTQQKPEKALEILGEDINPLNQERAMLAQVYLAMGKSQKAEEVLQTNMYHPALNIQMQQHRLSGTEGIDTCLSGVPPLPSETFP